MKVLGELLHWGKGQKINTRMTFLEDVISQTDFTITENGEMKVLELLH